MRRSMLLPPHPSSEGGASLGKGVDSPSPSLITSVRNFTASNPLLAKTLRNVAHLAGGNVSAMALNMLVLALMARLLGPVMLGVFAMLESYGTLIDQLVRLETWQPLIRYGARAIEAGERARFAALVKLGMLSDLAGAAAAGAIAWASVPLAGWLLSWSADTESLARWYCLSVFAAISSTPVGVLRLFDRFRQFAWLEPASAAVRLAGVALLLTVHGSTWHLLIWLVVVLWMYRLALALLALRELARHGYANFLSARLSDIHDLLRGYWRLTVAVNVAALVRKSTQQLDVLIVGGLAGPASAGVYNFARRITLMAIKGGTMVQQVALPDLSRLWARSDVPGFRRLVFQIEIVSAAAGLAFVLLVAAGGNSFVQSLAGPRFAQAALPLLLQSVAACLFLCGSALRPALIVVGAEKQLLMAVIVSAALFYAGLFLFVPALGAVGASTAHILFNLALLPAGAVAFAKAARR